jgi:hypothetical protein
VRGQDFVERVVAEVLAAASPALLERLPVDGPGLERQIADGAHHQREKGSAFEDRAKPGTVTVSLWRLGPTVRA